MKRLLMITSAIGLCLAAPAFAQTAAEQEQLNKQRANQPATSAPANQAAPRAANPPQSATSNQQQPAQNSQAQGQQQPSSTNAQAPSNQNQSGQAQNQQQPAASNPPASSAQAPSNQNQSGQAQSRQKPANNATNTQAPANQQQRSATDRNQPAQSGQAQQNNQQQNAQGDRTRSGQSQRDNQRDSARSQNRNTDRASASLNVNINDQQRTRISAAISSTNVRPVNVNFRIATGIAVPRSVALHTLPSTIVDIVPQYRGYNYFVTRDQIVIVEPQRKTIVAVLPAGGSARAQAPASSNGVSFTDQQREVIRSRSSSMRSSATTGSGASRLVIEQEVPETIELEEFPAEIVTEVPTVRSYRYFRQDNDVVVVDPAQRRVIEIIR